MLHIKEQQQSHIAHSITTNEGTMTLNIHKDVERKTNPTISDVEQMNENIDINGIIFVICRSCFWCTSILSIKHFLAENCPNCSLAMLESIPIMSNEKFEVNHDQKRGLTLQFSPR